jgi:hypothetical protein
MVIRKVRFRMSGGFAGLTRGSELDVADLAAPERLALERHLIQERPARDERARDLQVYELEVDTSTGTHRVEFDEVSVPTGLGGLIARLAQHAKPVAP